MRFAVFRRGEQEGLAAAGPHGGFRGLLSGDAGYPGSLDVLIWKGRSALDAAAAALGKGTATDLDRA